MNDGNDDQRVEKDDEGNVQEKINDDHENAIRDNSSQGSSFLERDGQGIVSDDGRMSNLQVSSPPFNYPQDPTAMAQYYEERMRDHAVAYASAAAGAAWAAAQIAASVHLPPALPSPIFYPPPPQYMHSHIPPPTPFQYNYADFTGRPPSDAANTITASRNPDERPGKRHHRLPPEATREQNERRVRRRQRDYSSSSDNPAYRHYHRNKYHRRHPKKRRENLIGKTGISALHEWCVKRKKRPPNFVLLPASGYFCFAAYLDNVEWGRGQGATKGAAKQDAARRALQALVPGVVFDSNGLVLSTEKQDDDLLPSLAQRLVIDTSNNATIKKRRCDAVVYPSTATSSGEEEFYSSRNFSVCSVLLHAMWQINDQIVAAPSYSFEVATETNSRPSSFACTGMLNLKIGGNNTNQERSKSDKLQPHSKSPVTYSISPELQTKTLSALGTGATKREARHAASAKLLAMLFPDCEGMIEVKAAAEAARETYAATKRTMRKLSDPNLPKFVINMARGIVKHTGCATVNKMRFDKEDEVSIESLSLSESNTLSPKNSIESSLLGRKKNLSDAASREQRRQQQLNELVDNALKNVNEFDIEDRSLHHDVGRTLLRRVEASDADSICRLMCCEDNGAQKTKEREQKYKSKIRELSPLHCMSSYTYVKQANVLNEFWGANSISLILCRAVAPFREPPLGCASLTFGFSMVRGRFLRVAEIGSERHLPQERFVECLEKFAANMNCELEYDINTAEKSFDSHFDDTIQPILLRPPQLNKIVESYFNIKEHSIREEPRQTLQVVEEEDIDGGEENEGDRKEQINFSIAKDKHRKRSRVD